MSLLSRFVGFLRGDLPPSVQPQDEARPAPDSAAAPADDLPRGIGIGRWLNFWERSWSDDEGRGGRCVEQVALARDDEAIHVALMGNATGHPALRGTEVAPADVNGAGMALLPGLLARFEQAPETVSLVRMISQSGVLIDRWREEAEASTWQPVAAIMAFAREDSAAQTLFVLLGKREGECVQFRLACHAPGEIPPESYPDAADCLADAGTASFWPAGFDRQRLGWPGFLAKALEDRSHTYLLGDDYARKQVPPQWPWALDDDAEEIEVARREMLDVNFTRGLDGDELVIYALRRSGSHCAVRMKVYWRIEGQLPREYGSHSEEQLALLELGHGLADLLTAIQATEPRRVALARIPLAGWAPVGEVLATDTQVLGYLTDGSVATLAMIEREDGGRWQPVAGAARCLVEARSIDRFYSARWTGPLLGRADVLQSLTGG